MAAPRVLLLLHLLLLHLLLPPVHAESCGDMVALLREEVEEMRSSMREDAEARSKEVKRLEAEVWDLRREVGEGRSASRDLPYMMACAFQDYWSEAGTTITYDYLLSDYNNANRPGGGDGVLDTS